MKDLHTCAPVLKIPNPNKKYVVCTDASLEALSKVLIQYANAILYESWKIKENEKIYDTHDLELDSIFNAF